MNKTGQICSTRTRVCSRSQATWALVNKELLTWTVPVNKELLSWTVPVKNLYVDGLYSNFIHKWEYIAYLQNMFTLFMEMYAKQVRAAHGFFHVFY